MEISAMCEALKRQIAAIDQRNERLKQQWTENEIEIVRIEEAIKVLASADKEYMGLGLNAMVQPLPMREQGL